MLKYKRLLAASTAVVLGAGSGFATSVLAQDAAQPTTPAPGNPPVPAGVGAAGPSADSIGSNFRRDGTVTVMQRPREGYEARGMRLGTLLVFPKVNIVAEHSDNIFASAINEESDLIWRVQPEVTVNSDWSRHSLQLFARAGFNKYQDNPDEDTNEWALGANGRLDVSRDTQVNGQFSFTHATEPRSAPNAAILPPGTDPVEYDVTLFGLVAKHEFNRLLATGRFDSTTFEYDSPRTSAGVIVDQSFRDRRITNFGGRLDYALSPMTAMFGEIIVNKHDPDKTTAGSVNRASEGMQAHVGVNFEVTALIRGDIGVGYLRQEFDGVGQEDLEGFSTNAQVSWLPTQLTTVTVSATRSIEDSAVPNAVAFLSTNVRARVDHELLRNLILTAQVGYGEDEYTGVTREDRRTTAGVGANYLINRTLGVSATYNYNKQETRRGTGANFEENKVAATLTVQY